MGRLRWAMEAPRVALVVACALLCAALPAQAMWETDGTVSQLGDPKEELEEQEEPRRNYPYDTWAAEAKALEKQFPASPPEPKAKDPLDEDTRWALRKGLKRELIDAKREYNSHLLKKKQAESEAAMAADLKQAQNSAALEKETGAQANADDESISAAETKKAAEAAIAQPGAVLLQTGELQYEYQHNIPAKDQDIVADAKSGKRLEASPEVCKVARRGLTNICQSFGAKSEKCMAGQKTFDEKCKQKTSPEAKDDQKKTESQEQGNKEDAANKEVKKEEAAAEEEMKAADKAAEKKAEKEAKKEEAADKAAEKKAEKEARKEEAADKAAEKKAEKEAKKEEAASEERAKEEEKAEKKATKEAEEKPTKKAAAEDEKAAAKEDAAEQEAEKKAAKNMEEFAKEQEAAEKKEEAAGKSGAKTANPDAAKKGALKAETGKNPKAPSKIAKKSKSTKTGESKLEAAIAKREKIESAAAKTAKDAIKNAKAEAKTMKKAEAAEAKAASSSSSVHVKKGSSLHQAASTSVHVKEGSSLHQAASTSTHMKAKEPHDSAKYYGKKGGILHRNEFSSVNPIKPSGDAQQSAAEELTRLAKAIADKHADVDATFKQSVIEAAVRAAAPKLAQLRHKAGVKAKSIVEKAEAQAKAVVDHAKADAKAQDKDEAAAVEEAKKTKKLEIKEVKEATAAAQPKEKVGALRSLLSWF